MKKSTAKTTAVEGEGSYTATHNYSAGVAKSVARGDTEELARKAQEAYDGPEGEALRRAETLAAQARKTKKPARKR